MLPAATPADRRRQLIATTFLALGNTNLEEQDKKQLRMDVVDEQLDVIGKGLLAQVVQYIAHYPIRQRGTFAGSIAHADPASEWCVVARLLEAEIVARSRRAQRVLPASGYFQGTFATALQPDEVITEVRLPVLDSSWRTGFSEFSRRAGDFAIAMTAVALKTSGRKISEARIAIGGVEDRPSRCAQAEAILVQGGSAAHTASIQASVRSGLVDSTLCAAKYSKLQFDAAAPKAMAPPAGGPVIYETRIYNIRPGSGDAFAQYMGERMIPWQESAWKARILAQLLPYARVTGTANGGKVTPEDISIITAATTGAEIASHMTTRSAGEASRRTGAALAARRATRSFVSMVKPCRPAPCAGHACRGGQRP